MPALDRYHDTVKHALTKEGWIITDDPFTVMLEERTLFIDLRAEKALESLIILVEIKSFEMASQIEALASAIGKYNLYQSALKLSQATDMLLLAVPVKAFHGIINEPIGQELIKQHKVHLLIFDPDKEELVQWII